MSKGDNDRKKIQDIKSRKKNIGTAKSLIHWLTDKSKHHNNLLNKQNGRGNFIPISGRGEFKLKVSCHLKSTEKL